jgi:uncharacterized protein YkwD
MTYCLLVFYHLWFNQTIEQHNIVRKDHGLQIFEIDEKLMKEANDHAIWMTKNETLQHSRFRYGAENIARASVNPKKVVELWMNSPGHRRNILNPRYTRIGVAVYKSTGGKYYWCTRFR